MPQLDWITFLPQFFWVAVGFISFYIVCLRFFLPRLARIFKVRNAKAYSDVSSKRTKNKLEPLHSFDSLLCNSLEVSTGWIQESREEASNWEKSNYQWRTNKKSLDQIKSSFQMLAENSHRRFLFSEDLNFLKGSKSPVTEKIELGKIKYLRRSFTL
uniref:ATP synthase F0 subunit 8 n=1 Tax=Mesostigma viride TaxID=41882 RepID=Q8W9T1_MESVI|nr:ATP synthase F0 subunit 8 [Mesostigma viride]AAL36727.1 ATP synthase F0 subunit 8 [Mesostigma viride]